MNLTPRQMIDIPPVWLLGFIAVAVLIGGPGAGTFVRVLAVLLILAGILVTVAAVLAFRRYKTTIVPHLSAARLIDTGIFAKTRNPIYLADALFLTAVCLWQGRWWLLILVPLFVFVIHWRFILGEESRLRAAFGQAYHVYTQTTRRWL